MKLGPTGELGGEPLRLGGVVGRLAAQEMIFEPFSQGFQEKAHWHFQLVTLLILVFVWFSLYAEQHFDGILQQCDVLTAQPDQVRHRLFLVVQHLYEGPAEAVQGPLHRCDVAGGYDGEPVLRGCGHIVTQVNTLNIKDRYVSYCVL